MKLTDPQRSLLRGLQIGLSDRVCVNHPSAYKLEQLGLITIERVPAPFGWKLSLTSEGAKQPTDGVRI